MSVKEKRTTGLGTLGKDQDNSPSMNHNESIPRVEIKPSSTSNDETLKSHTSAKISKADVKKAPDQRVLKKKLETHLASATHTKEQLSNYSLSGKNTKDAESPIKFINKRNDYSETIQEYDLDKDIEEDKYRRRSSIIEQGDQLIDQWHKLQKIAFEKTGDAKIYEPNEDPRDFNVLWRGYVKVLNQACEKTKEISEKTKDAKEEDITSAQEDPELELFDEMSTKEKIMKLNIFLRSEIYYCCYCGIKYKTEQELYKHCPGIRQEDHE